MASAAREGGGVGSEGEGREKPLAGGFAAGAAGQPCALGGKKTHRQTGGVHTYAVMPLRGSEKKAGSREEGANGDSCEVSR